MTWRRSCRRSEQCNATPNHAQDALGRFATRVMPVQAISPAVRPCPCYGRTRSGMAVDVSAGGSSAGQLRHTLPMSSCQEGRPSAWIAAHLRRLTRHKRCATLYRKHHAPASIKCSSDRSARPALFRARRATTAAGLSGRPERPAFRGNRLAAFRRHRRPSSAAASATGGVWFPG